MLSLAEGLLARGFQVDVVLTKATGPFLANAQRMAIRIVDLRAKRVYSSLFALMCYLRREQPPVLISSMSHANVVALVASRLAKCRTRVVVCEHNNLSETTSHKSGWKGALMPRLLRMMYPLAERIVGVSHGVAEDLARHIRVPPGRVNVIHNPVVTKDLLAQAEVPLEHPWFGVGLPPVVLAVGRLTLQKDFPTLIHAFHILRKGRPAKLIILGEGEDRNALCELVRSLGLADDVALPGFVANPYAYMKNAAVLASSSAWEGLPTVLIEAMACGLSVVATDCPSGAREILEDGKWGRLVSLRDPGAMASAIASSIDSPTQGVRERAAHFFADRAVDRYLNLLDLPQSCAP